MFKRSEEGYKWGFPIIGRNNWRGVSFMQPRMCCSDVIPLCRNGMKVGRKVGFGKKSKISPVFLLGFFEHCERITPSEDAKANLLSEWNCFWTCRGMSQGDWQESKYLLISSAAFKLTLFCSFIWSVYVRFVVPTSNVKASCLLFLILYIHSLQKHFRVKCFGKTLKNMIGLNQTFNSNLSFSTRRFGFTCLFLKSENVFPILN